MSATAQSSTGQRRQAWYRLVLTLLLAAIMIALAQLLASLLSLGSAARADSAGVLVAQATATALANTPPVPGGDAVVPRAKRVPPLPAQQFSTNTPRPPAATACACDAAPASHSVRVRRPCQRRCASDCNPDSGDGGGPARYGSAEYRAAGQ
jgi:hypothetical protein